MTKKEQSGEMENEVTLEEVKASLLEAGKKAGELSQD